MKKKSLTDGVCDYGSGGRTTCAWLDDLRFEIVVAMVSEDPKLYERLKVYFK